MKVQELIQELQKYKTNGEVVIGISADMLHYINEGFPKDAMGVKLSVMMADDAEGAYLGLDLVPVATTLQAIY